MSPDPSRPYIVLNAVWLLVEGLFVSFELPALKEPWSISSKGRVATASFADIELKDSRMVQSTRTLGTPSCGQECTDMQVM